MTIVAARVRIIRKIETIPTRRVFFDSFLAASSFWRTSSRRLASSAVSSLTAAVTSASGRVGSKESRESIETLRVPDFAARYIVSDRGFLPDIIFTILSKRLYRRKTGRASETETRSLNREETMKKGTDWNRKKVQCMVRNKQQRIRRKRRLLWGVPKGTGQSVRW